MRTLFSSDKCSVWGMSHGADANVDDSRFFRLTKNSCPCFECVYVLLPRTLLHALTALFHVQPNWHIYIKATFFSFRTFIFIILFFKKKAQMKAKRWGKRRKSIYNLLFSSFSWKNKLTSLFIHSYTYYHFILLINFLSSLLFFSLTWISRQNLAIFSFSIFKWHFFFRRSRDLKLLLRFYV